MYRARHLAAAVWAILLMRATPAFADLVITPEERLEWTRGEIVSFLVVGAIALVVAAIALWGLRRLARSSRIARGSTGGEHSG